MLHRAIVGSLERFIGMLTENCAGAFPAWLAPTQAVVCSISESSQAYAEQVAKGLKAQAYRAEADVRGEKITLKIREQSLKKVPFIAVVGDKEAQAGNVAVRGRGGVDLGVMPVNDFYTLLAKTVAEKAL
jgi:threonyl-tRNA synthetase